MLLELPPCCCLSGVWGAEVSSAPVPFPPSLPILPPGVALVEAAKSFSRAAAAAICAAANEAGDTGTFGASAESFPGEEYS